MVGVGTETTTRHGLLGIQGSEQIANNERARVGLVFSLDSSSSSGTRSRQKTLFLF